MDGQPPPPLRGKSVENGKSGSAFLVPGKDRARTWLTLFKAVDVDDSGLIVFDEMLTVVRKQLKLTSEELPTQRIKALWIALDADSGGQISSTECVPLG